MHASTQSASERAALAFYATLPFPVDPAQSFAPHLPIYYRDGAGIELEGRPDALCTQHHTFIESKAGTLNNHRDKASSHWALQQEYTRRMQDGRDKPYNFLTDYFYWVDPGFLHDNAWNQSLFKVLALQALHGWERYVVCFQRNPSAADAKRYAEAGLVFCTEATLSQMLGVIDLASHGFYYPFTLRAPRSGYSITVNPAPNPDYAGFTPEQITSANRAKYEAVVADARAAAQADDCF
ncbi:hypothetical protein ACI48D_08265 [Massilia sp. LXY-6]|uniref:hypothetical protein n=1 Tax=Massilia sp. LXY-6 TaxID=3379823 RepID=UPI003EDF8307